MSSFSISSQSEALLSTESETHSRKAVDDSSIVLTQANRRFITVPTRHCLLTRVSVAAKNARDLNAAIPFALEDQLADPVEDLHFCYGPKDDDGQRAVIVCHRDLMQQWSDQFANSDGFVIPDVLALPYEHGTWTVALSENRAMVRIGKHTGFECRSEQLENLLQLYAIDPGKPEAINFWSEKNGSTASFSDSSLANLVQIHHFNDFEEWLQSDGQPVDDIDLRSGHFSRSNTKRPALRGWLPALVLFVVALCLHVYLSISEIRELTASTRTLNQQSETLFKTAFPDVNRIVNMRIQAEQELRQLEAGMMDTGGDFFVVFTNSMAAVADLKDVVVTGFNWQRETMQLQLSATSLTQLEALRQRVASKGYTVDIVNALNNEDGLRAQLRIRK